MDIRELSFRSENPVPSIPYWRYRVRLLSGASLEEQPAELGRIARKLKLKHSEAIIAYASECSILSPKELKYIDDAEILECQNIELTSDEYDSVFTEACNFYLTKSFKKASSSPKIDFYKKRIYSSNVFLLSSGQKDLPECLNGNLEIIEGQRYLNFDLFRDKNNFLVLTLDFGSEYHSRKTLDQLKLDELRAGQRLIHTYDNKACDFSRVADHDISAPIADLGNNSIIQYHQQRGNLPTPLHDEFDSSCMAVKVRYSQSKGAKFFEASHAPQLLRKLYDRTQIDNDEFDNYLWPIQTKAQNAIETIRFLNANAKFRIFNLPITFAEELLRPLNIKQVNTQGRRDNLFFGNHPENDKIKSIRVSYPSAALKKHYLLDKPSSPVKTMVLYPSHVESEARKYSACLKKEFNQFGIDIRRAYQDYDPLSQMAMRRVCKEIKDCDLVLAFVPSQDDYLDGDENDPYRVIKRQLVQRRIPSQMVTLPMLNKGWNDNVGHNLVLGINAKLGHTSWCIASMPGDADLFIGLDVSRKEGVTVGASSFVFNESGQLLQWSATDFQAYQESFNPEILENLILDLYSQSPIKKLVVHRDGKLQSEEFSTLKKVEAILKQEGLISLDAVEVIKSGFCRAVAYQPRSQDVSKIYTNPPRGWIWEHSRDEAVILTTGDREAKVSDKSAPRPLRIRKRIGEMDLLTLAEQVYWLSEMQVGSTQTIRLPITTYYADRAAGFAQERLLPLGLQNERRLWFL